MERLHFILEEIQKGRGQMLSNPFVTLLIRFLHSNDLRSDLRGSCASIFSALIVILFIIISWTSYVSAEKEEPLVVAYNPKLPPFHFDKGQGDAGFSIDLMNGLAERMDRDVIYVQYSQTEAINRLQNGDVDVILSAYFNEDHARIMEFTDSYLSTSVGLIVHESNDEIDGLPHLSESITALERDTLEYEFLRNIRGIHYHTTSSQPTALELLINGRAKAFVGNILTADYLLEEKGLADEYKMVGSYLLPIDYSMTVQKENYLLMDQLNRAIREVKGDGTYSQLFEKWFESENELTDKLWLAIQVIGSLLILILILFLLGIKWNRQLQREVDKKTNVLNELNQTLQDQVEQTKSSDQFKKQILNSSPRGIATVDDKGIITSFNAKANEMAGVKGSSVNRPYQEVKILKQLLEDKFEHVFTSKHLFLGEDAIWQRKDDRVYFLRYYVYPLYNLEKKITGIIVTFEDVTEEQKLRLQIFEQEKNQALGRVIAGIAHEIRNPLTSIKTFVELIPKKFKNERFQKEISTYVPQEIERVSTLIEGLIDYAKPKQLKKEIIEVRSFLNECTILFKRTAMNSGINLRCDASPHLFIEADQNQLKQVIINLIINGIDAMEMTEMKEEQVLHLDAIERNGNVIISVTDQGIGMTEEERKQALEPFFTTKTKGSGLGLAIVQQYVRENKGHLYIESKVGVGTNICLSFDKERGECIE
ncbi:transporter substrate-binding domain-containing protein [Alteribacter populi]|uniref:transporter substrate-binding domain-containing protein n=1 Tax=Alteribacter populi TaxID=2011011 RepID=UPI001E55C93D|nr:transporter substrate-binding domain-containing protein [Alteribacter populi]